MKRYPEYFKDVGVPAMIAGGLVGGLSPGVGRVQEKSQEQAQPSRVAGPYLRVCGSFLFRIHIALSSLGLWRSIGMLLTRGLLSMLKM